MIFPTTAVLGFSAILMTILLAADWYVWGMTYARNFRQPVKPCGEIEGVVSGPAVQDGHGFKKVA
jgi:hypothetical protein